MNVSKHLQKDVEVNATLSDFVGDLGKEQVDHDANATLDIPFENIGENQTWINDSERNDTRLFTSTGNYTSFGTWMNDSERQDNSLFNSPFNDASFGTRMIDSDKRLLISPENNASFYKFRGTDNATWFGGSRADDHFRDALHGYIVLVICFCGAVGNALTIAVLTRQRVRRTVSANETVVYYGLVLLSITDLLFCLSVLPRAVVADGNIFRERGSFSMTYQLYCTGLITTFSLISTWLIVVTAAVRYVGICHPLRARYLVSRHVVVTSLVAVVALCVLVNLPAFWMHQVVDLSTEEPITSDNVTAVSSSTLYLIDLGEFSHETPKGHAFLWARMILAIFVPLLLLLYFNCCLIAALHRSDRFRRGYAPASGGRSQAGSRRCCRGSGEGGEGGQEREEVFVTTQPAAERQTRISAKNRLTTILVFIVLFFVLLVYPCEILDFLSHLTGFIHPDPEAFMIARLVTNVLQVSNFSFNFLLYCALNARFRTTVSRLFFCRRRDGAKANHSGDAVNFCYCCCCPSGGKQCRRCGRCRRCGGRGTPDRPLEPCSEANRVLGTETTASSSVGDSRTRSQQTTASCVLWESSGDFAESRT